MVILDLDTYSVEYQVAHQSKVSVSLTDGADVIRLIRAAYAAHDEFWLRQGDRMEQVTWSAFGEWLRMAL